jgi:hypothetical protein
MRSKTLSLRDNQQKRKNNYDLNSPPVDCQFGNAANMFSNFLTIIASLDFC